MIANKLSLLGLWVAIGGALGASARYGLLNLVDSYFPALSFPLGTLIANVMGSFVAGLLIGLLLTYLPTAKNLQIFLMTGVLGGFTTFSAFSLETIKMIDSGHKLMALLYIMISISLALLAVMLGLWLSRS